ncbi:ABC transporter ATP-binding protein [Pseudomonas sp. DTU_2021_1001937_2_SI_NGA_ILE_001]|uniref:ABC transporter ATP-binding protein n=1 Tax=Pseudomonas sp. DTU_2021_1001937_2_SI_NGA_ILE_001 TaxID=3077589 RepID=UPI0028FC0BD9|nr:ABC transporter ATP-binding protein [Pseudomonas sp. DTU_2021_1001937_2_SI_NGA_ILE_001]WNW09913.1 ABC transporter ATP-binding protein [Pseudomonas sp. DTU_2021_1001937_2_SI_NGA_ILE_001]
MTHLAIERLNWGDAQRFRLVDIDLQVADGEFVGLIGPNGSGKTSLLRCAWRFSRPAGGQVRLAGEDLWLRSQRWSAQHIAVMQQEFPQDFGLSVAEVVGMGRAPHKKLLEGDNAEDRALVEQALQRTGMHAHGARAFASLSGGEKQRVLLARALVQQPRLLILDEPTNHLDPRYQLELLQLLRRLRLSTLASFHDLNLAAAFCDRLYVLKDGQAVASGTPAQVLTPALLHEVFGLQALVDTHPLAPHPRITWITRP